jgi:hypothetical protein
MTSGDFKRANRFLSAHPAREAGGIHPSHFMFRSANLVFKAKGLKGLKTTHTNPCEIKFRSGEKDSRPPSKENELAHLRRVLCLNSEGGGRAAAKRKRNRAFVTGGGP